jgi:hypothetical protein
MEPLFHNRLAAPSKMLACDGLQALRLNVRFIFGLTPTEAGVGYRYNYLKRAGVWALSKGKFMHRGLASCCQIPGAAYSR